MRIETGRRDPGACQSVRQPDAPDPRKHAIADRVVFATRCDRATVTWTVT
jgi:hypothetical protein